MTIAIMDTGVADHPVFEGKDVLPGFSLLSGETDGRTDVDGHGTAVAAGVLLAAPEATIMPVRLDSGSTDFGGALGEAEYGAFRRAADEGADVLVVPWHITGEAFEEDLETIQYVIDKGAIVVASSGNEPGEQIGFPASTPGVVAVTGADENGDFLSATSTTGPEVVLSSPADEMTVPVPSTGSLGGDSSGYSVVTGGTSMGAAVAAGVAALTWSAHPDLDASNVIQRLIQTAGDGSGTRGGDTGFGLVDADQAVNAGDIEQVDENPLGYPMGEAGASGATPDDPTSEAPEEEQEPGAVSGGPSTSAGGNKESNLSGMIVVAAAVVLVGAAIAVWLVLRGRGRKAAQAQQPGFNAGNDPTQVGYQQPAPNPTYVPPMGGGQQGYGGPPPGQQGYSSPPPGYGQPGHQAEPSPWRPGDPNQR
ncbi:S8 family serine peptidase [Glycomyces endophyticus]|uniref:S8 family serine peptidase n=1 Tax=Glycomyces endophyticus TaxID=480996 RepID=UPI0031DEA6F4